MSFLRRRPAIGAEGRNLGQVVKAVVSKVRTRADAGSPADHPVPPLVPDQLDRPDLIAAAIRARWPHKAPETEILQALAEELLPRPRAKVVLIGGTSVSVMAQVLRQVYPELRLLVIDPAASKSQVHVALCVANPYNLIVDLADPDSVDQVNQFMRTFMHLGRGGAYLVQRVRAAAPVPEREEDEPPAATDGLDLTAVLALAARVHTTIEDLETLRDVAALGACLGEVRVVGAGLSVRNAKRVRPKLRDYEMNAVLVARPELGRLLQTRPGTSLASRCDYQASSDFVDDAPEEAFVDPFLMSVLVAPSMHLRVYQEPTCGRGQIVESNGLFMTDTFRQVVSKRLLNVYINDTAPLFGDVRIPLGAPTSLEGAYFHFDSEWPGHFGHTMTEQISRLWAYRQAKELEPGLKLLTALPKIRTDQRLQNWELALLAPYGIEADDVVVFDKAVRPERLYAATPMFSSPYYVHEGISDTWDLIGNMLAEQASEQPRARRIFCSRRSNLKRACRNTPEVEQLFIDHGFTVVYPEDYPMAEQVAMFRAADVIGGFAGSALFTMAFCRTPKTMILIGPESYTARNEYLFASVRGHRLRMVWSRPDIAHPEGGWTTAAFSSSYAVDFRREGAYLREVLALLPC